MHSYESKPPESRKGRPGKDDPSKLTTKALRCNKNPDTTRKSKQKLGLLVDRPSLWDRVAPGAEWRECVDHKAVARPDLTLQPFKCGTVHLKATCPHCGSFLGHISQRRPVVTDEAALERHYLAYRSEALAAGNKVGAAYYRFLADFGRKPDPKWLWNGGAACN